MCMLWYSTTHTGGHRLTLSFILLLFFSYSIIGWISEVVYCSLMQHKLVNRGFLHGPLCPVYGFGGLLVVFLLKPFSENLFYLFAMGVFITSALEYITGWALETVFSTKWWDYSTYRFNIHGRVCLRNSLMFGILSVVGVLFIHPFLLSTIARIPDESQEVLALFLFIILAFDFCLTLKTLINIDAKLSALKEFTEGLRDSLDVREWFNEHDLLGSFERLKALTAKDSSESLARLSARFEHMLAHTGGMRRIFSAFPMMQSKDPAVHTDIFKRPRIKVAKATAKVKKAEVAPVSPAYIETAIETPVTGFAPGFSFYKLFWVYFIASFVGVILEMIWCVLTRGHIESRTGLIYGMLNPVYGFGGLVMTVILSRREKSRDLRIFVGSMLIGGVFEYLCSLLQELAFGTVSWEYSNTQLNLHGRTNLMFTLMWGFLGLLWVREVYPPLSKMIERIPLLLGKILTFILLAGILANITVSSFAVHRWSDRHHGVASGNVVETFFDTNYPDEFLREIYPNMQFVE